GPESIDMVEAHGTGTRLGDPIEFEALTRAFGTKKTGFCVLSSVKSNIGHVNVAAGVSSLIKAVLSLENGGLPPTLHFRKPNPGIDLAASPFVIRTKFTPWETNGHPRRCGVSAFGFGGTNAHFVLQEAPVLPAAKTTRPAHLIPLSARSPAALNKAAAALAVRLETHPGLPLADAAFTLAEGREEFKYRRAVVCRDVREAVSELKERGAGSTEARPDRSIVFLFPGQGVQYAGMGRELYLREPTFRLWLDRSAEILSPLLGEDIRRIIHPDSGDPGAAAELLRQTRFAQPAIFAVSYALARMWMDWGVKPAALLGHSLGEYTAACLAGVFSLEDSLTLVARRGEMMDRLPEGAMLAVSLSEEETLPFLDGELSLAAVNAPALCVISGPKEPVEDLRRKLEERNTSCRYLRTSHAFHSPMMEPLAEDYGRMLESVPRAAPRLPVFSTVTGGQAAPDDIVKTDYWIRNARQTVRFSEAVRAAAAEPGRILLETGPGRTLTQLARMNIAPAAGQVTACSLPDPKDKTPDTEFILGSLGSLWAAGMNVDWKGFYRSEPRRRVSLPTYPFERKRFWAEPTKPGPAPVSRFEQLNRKTKDPAGWFYTPTWKRASSPAPAPPAVGETEASSSWLVFLDELGLGETVVRRLRREGHSVAVVKAGRSYRRLGRDGFVVNPRSEDDYLSLCSDLRDRGRFPEKIAHLWNLTSAPAARRPANLADVDRALDLGFYSLVRLAQGFGKENIAREIRTFVVSNGLQDVTGSERIRPEKAPLLGPVKVIPQEYPNVKCCQIDLDVERPAEIRLPLVELILKELRSDIPDLLVAFRGGRRWVQDFEPLRPGRVPKETKLLKQDGVYLITGGLGGIGLTLAEYFAREAKARLILTGRTRLPARNHWARYLKAHPRTDQTGRRIRDILRLEGLGARVIYAASDAADEKKMTEKISRASARFGPIDGVVHAAGLPGEGILQLKKTEEAAKILAPKIHGTIVLDRILKKHRPEFIVLCSSVASVLGGIGLGDYSAANAFLDAYAMQGSRRGRRVVAVDWDMWGQVGMGLKTHMPDELKEWFRQELRNGLTTREGIDAFRRTLALTDSPNVIVSTRDLGVRVDLWIKREFIREKENSLRKNDEEPKHDRPDLETAFVAPETETEKKVAAIWRRLFGIARIGRRDNFYELGGHSLLATTLLSHLRREMGSQISIRDVLDHPTIADLCALIDRTAAKTKPGRAEGEAR
ncbi:MAG: SDR family NAD(P)-dependent oxidoreductase, partial [Candidatus Aminicenantes bacterium]|nr:SDR family NAD(P)-dependent oxidoreductase [Candidatus Aminicenantes bacterium]